MKLVVGLGNPGPKYELSRHNAGFIIVDQLASLEKGAPWQDQQKFKGLVSRASVFGFDCLLLKPTTFMNLSGQAVVSLLGFYKIAPQDLVVIHDDIDVPFGKVKARLGGGHGGNNGIRSIIDLTGDHEFARIKLGVGKPVSISEEHGKRPPLEVRDWVLQRFSDDELKVLSSEMYRDFLDRLRGIFLQQGSLSKGS